MFDDEVPPPEQPLMERVSSPLNAQLLEFWESDLFQETAQNSEVASSSNNGYEEQSSYAIDPLIPSYLTKCQSLMDNTATASATVTNELSLMFEDEITPVDLIGTSHFTNNQYAFSNQDQFEFSSLQNQNQLNDPNFQYPLALSNDHVVPATGTGPTTLLNAFDVDSTSLIPSSKFMLSSNTLSSNYPFMDPSASFCLPALTKGGNLYLGNDIQIHELEYYGGNNGIFYTDHVQHSFNSNDLQAFSNEGQHRVNEGGSCMTPFTSDITSLESGSLRVTSKLSSKERKEKIKKYMKKRNERNFNKKIKYVCRKTLADSRPRVRGRFAKHDEFGENNKTNSNHEEDSDEDGRIFNEVMKEEEEDFESSDFLTHINGVNSYNSNYSIHSSILNP